MAEPRVSSTGHTYTRHSLRSQRSNLYVAGECTFAWPAYYSVRYQRKKIAVGRQKASATSDRDQVKGGPYRYIKEVVFPLLFEHTAMTVAQNLISCQPAGILKSCVDTFAPIITHLANLSFKEGKFPRSFKAAQV